MESCSRLPTNNTRVHIGAESSAMRCASFTVAALAVAIGVLVASSPSGVAPPVVPDGSATNQLPPWPVFRVAIALNEFFEAAAWATRPPAVQVKSLGTAYWQSEIAYSLTKSGIIDTVGTTGATCAAVASSKNLVHDFCCRMMSAGEGLKLLTRAVDGTYTLTPAGDLLRSSHPSSLRAFMLMINEETNSAWRAVGTDSLRTGVSGFKQHFGNEFWDWHSTSGREAQMAQFDAAMTSFSAEIAGSLLVDWAPPMPNATVCDVGGGAGHMLVAMAQHWPELRGVVFDLPPVAGRTADRPRLVPSLTKKANPSSEIVTAAAVRRVRIRTQPPQMA